MRKGIANRIVEPGHLLNRMPRLIPEHQSLIGTGVVKEAATLLGFKFVESTALPTNEALIVSPEGRALARLIIEQ